MQTGSCWGKRPTDASVHDSNVIDPLIEEKDNGQPLYLDAGYEAKDDVVWECGMIPVICEKGPL